MTHDELRELVPIYALDALEGDEELEVRSHVEGCLDCQEALELQLQAAGNLALMVEPVRPPDALRGRVLQAVAERAQTPEPSEAAGTPPRPLGWQRVAAIVAVAAVLVLGALGYSLVQRLNDRDRQLATERRFVAALGAPILTTVPMTAAGNAVNASGRIYVAADGKSAGLVATGLSDPGRSVYVLWLIVDTQPIPVAPFRPDSTGLALVSIKTNLSQMQSMAVTLEQHAGTRTPQGPFVLKTA